MDISCYSFTEVARHAAPLMNEGGSLLTLTYYGAEKVMPHYNVMGLAKAALEASVRYLAAEFGGGEHSRKWHFCRTHPKPLLHQAVGVFSVYLKVEPVQFSSRNEIRP
jgi:Enoyl-[acyl-carrier-protein] reductase (NADH)